MKSSLNLSKSELGHQLAATALLLMIVGLFTSRALLSISIGLFFLSAPLRLGRREWIHQASKDPLVWVGSLLWVLPVVSGFWSENLYAWWDVVRIKLPLLLLPLGGVGLHGDKKRYEWIGWTLVALVGIGSIYSLIPWMQDAFSMHADYLRGGSLPTLLDNDRVRFSWLVVAMCWWMQGKWENASTRQRWLIGGLILFFIFFLHVLAVRIGLVCFYMLAGFLLIRRLLDPAHRRGAVILLLLLMVLPFLLYYTLPTFRARVDYIRYDWSYTFQGKYLSGGNDAVRVQSLQVAGEVIRAHPVYGVGFGDIRSEMDSVYHRVNPNLSESERIYPTNEWAVYGVGMGWIGVIGFTVGIIALFFIPMQDAFRWRAWVLATILSLVTDIGLEVQYGLFLIPFFLLFFRDGSNPVKNREIRS